MKNKIIADANFLVALVCPEDPHNQKAEKIFQNLVGRKPIFITNNYVIAEVFTIILLRTKDVSRVKIFHQEFLKTYQNILKVDYLPNNLEPEIYKLFTDQKKYRGGFLSYVDCALIIQAKKEKISSIIAFDKVFKQFETMFQIIGL